MPFDIAKMDVIGMNLVNPSNDLKKEKDSKESIYRDVNDINDFTI